MTQNQGSWYVRKKGHVTGPFSSVVITNHLIVGRLKMLDEISTDEKNWTIVQNFPELHPDLSKEELDRVKRQLDERTGNDRRDKQSVNAEHLAKRKGERRAKEGEEMAIHRALRQKLMEGYQHRRQKMFWPLLITFVALVFITLLAIRHPTMLPVPLPNCSSDAGPDINWNNCLKPKINLNELDLSRSSLRNAQLVGAQMMNTTLTKSDIAYTDLRFTNLSYADLSYASLLGADLSHSDLSYSDLSHADLSFANLTDSNLGQANLTNTRFDNAIWLDGTICAKESIGECKVELKRPAN